jgi:hypothetical protein
MSISSNNQSNLFGVDVLHMIFQHLEGEDLANCEAVCRQWRDILLAETQWKRLIGRKKERSSSWRRAQRVLEKNQPTSRTGQYRGVCKDVLQVKSNWRTGNFKISTYLVSERDMFTLAIGEDCVAWKYCPSDEPEPDEGCTFLDTESMEITEVPVYSPYFIVNGMLVRWDDTSNIWNSKFNCNIDEEQEGFNVSTICYGSGMLVSKTNSREWKLFD